MNKRFPRRSGLLFPAAVLLFVCSCAGGPEQIPDVPVIRPSEQPARDTSADLVPEEPRTPPAEELREPEPEPEPEPEIPAGEEFLPEEKAGILLPPGISRDEPEEPLPEPSIDFAEISVEPQAPQEEALGLVLPEPPDPYFPDPPAESPAIVEAPAEPPVQPAAPLVPPIVPLVPAVPDLPPVPSPPQEPPAVPVPPPPLVRPAEEDTPIPVREPVVQPVLPESPARRLPEIKEPGINFSRVVRATVGQLVEVPFRGTGWVYLGELGARPGIVYSSRRLDPDGQSFVFRVEAAGTYGLRFYKQDFVQDYILNDYVQVIAGEPPEAAAMGWFNPAVDRGRVVAEPRWPSALEEAEIIGRELGIPGAAAVQEAAAGPGAGGGAPGAVAAQGAAQEPAQEPAERPVISDDGVIPVPSARPSVETGNGAPAAPGSSLPAENLTPGEYLDRAQREYDAGRVATALSVLDQFREQYPSGSDEAWWLYGQFYEASSPSRDIRTALDYYRRLVQEYPQSRRYNDARRRMAYLERYYINIR